MRASGQGPTADGRDGHAPRAPAPAADRDGAARSAAPGRAEADGRSRAGEEDGRSPRGQADGRSPVGEAADGRGGPGRQDPLPLWAAAALTAGLVALAVVGVLLYAAHQYVPG